MTNSRQLIILVIFGISLLFFNFTFAQVLTEGPYFSLEKTFIDLGEEKTGGKYNISAHPSVNWQASSPAIDQGILTLSKITGQGSAEISFSVDKIKLESGWHDLQVNYNWQAFYQGSEVIGSDHLFIRVFVGKPHLLPAPPREEKVPTEIPTEEVIEKPTEVSSEVLRDHIIGTPRPLTFVENLIRFKTSFLREIRIFIINFRDWWDNLKINLGNWFNNLTKGKGGGNPPTPTKITLTPSQQIDRVAITYCSTPIELVDCNTPTFQQCVQNIKWLSKRACAQVRTAKLYLEGIRDHEGFRRVVNCNNFGIYAIDIFCDSRGQVNVNRDRLSRFIEILKGGLKKWCNDSKFDIDCIANCAPGTNAYVNWKPIDIQICPSFCSLNDSDKERVLIHEITHFGDSSDDVNDILNAYRLERFIPLLAEDWFR